jgi:hypothetical protein
MEYNEFRREIGKDALKSLTFFFVAVPIGIALFVYSLSKYGAFFTFTAVPLALAAIIYIGRKVLARKR